MITFTSWNEIESEVGHTETLSPKSTPQVTFTDFLPSDGMEAQEEFNVLVRATFVSI